MSFPLTEDHFGAAFVAFPLEDILRQFNLPTRLIVLCGFVQLSKSGSSSEPSRSSLDALVAVLIFGIGNRIDLGRQIAAQFKRLGLPQMIIQELLIARILTVGSSNEFRKTFGRVRDDEVVAVP